MEKFVDHIIETDKKAREILEKARVQKERIIADTAVQKEKAMTEQEKHFNELMQEMADNAAKDTAREIEEAAADFEAKKSAMQAYFAQHSKQWEEDIIAHTKQI